MVSVWATFGVIFGEITSRYKNSLKIDFLLTYKKQRIRDSQDWQFIVRLANFIFQKFYSKFYNYNFSLKNIEDVKIKGKNFKLAKLIKKNFLFWLEIF